MTISRAFLRIISMLAPIGIGVGLYAAYPTIKGSVFPTLPEAEVHTYILGIAVYLAALSVLILLNSSRDEDPKPPTRQRNPMLPILLSLFGVTVISVCWYLIGRPDTNIRTQLNQMGIDFVTVIPAVMVPVLMTLVVVFYGLSTGRVFGAAWNAPIIALTIFTIIVLTWYIGPLNYYDTTHYIGPLQDFRMGIPLLTGPTWYGFVPLGLLGLLFSIIPVTLLNFTVTIATIGTAGLILFFLFLLWFFRDVRWALLGIALALLFNFLVQYGYPNYYAQATFVRFGIWLLVASAIYTGRPVMIGLAIGTAFFWTTDMGLYITGAYLSTIWLMSIRKDIRRGFGEFIRSVKPAAVGIGTVFLAINGVYLLAYNAFPHWSNYWRFSWSYTTIPMFALPIPFSMIPWIFLAVPVVTLSVLLFSDSGDSLHTPNNRTVLFLALVGIFTFTYFTGDSHLNALHSISLPYIVCFVWLLQRCIEWSRAKDIHVTRAIVFALSASLTIPVSVWTYQALMNISSGPAVALSARNIVRPPVTERSLFGSTADAVAAKYAEAIRTKDFAVISPFDTWYITLWDTTNTLGSNCLLCYWTRDAAGPIIRNAHALTVRYLFVDRDHTGYEGRVGWIFDDTVKLRYRFIERLGDLDIYERI